MSWLKLAELAQPVSDASKPGILARYDEVDAKLVAAGWPATSPWWREQIGRFFGLMPLLWTLRVGRRGGKSTTLCRVAVVWALYGDWSVPPGDAAIVPFVSINRSEATSRLRTIADILKALGLKFEQRPGEIELRAPRHVIFRVQACTVGAVSGFTSIAAFCDEVSKWRTADTGANPAGEVVRSLKPTLATQQLGFLVLSSSPWTRDDYHAKQFDAGDGPSQLTAWAPTWVANPTPEVAESRTHELEQDEPTWRREYAAIPSDGSATNWFGRAIDIAVTHDAAPEHYGTTYIIAIDAAFLNDLFGWAVVASHRDPTTGKRITWTHASGSWEPEAPALMAARVKSELCDRYKTTRVYGDQHEASSFQELSRQAGYYLEIVPWLGTSAKEGKTARFRAVRTAMLDGAFRIPNDNDLISEMRRFEGIYSDGNERVHYIGSEGSRGHGDRVSALVLAGSIALSRAANDVKDEPVRPGTPEWAALEQQRMRAEAIAELNKKHRKQSFRKAIGM